MGAPRQFDREALVPMICKRLATGEPLTVICRDLGVSRRSVQLWRKDDPEIDEQMQEARDDGYDVIAADCLGIADDGSRDYSKDADGREVVDHDHIQRSKLRVDTRLKLLAKWDPRRYGDKIEHTGPGGGPIQTLTCPVSADELRAIAADMAAKV